MMKKPVKPVKAYKNLEFLNSAEARTIRILSEFYEPQTRFRKNHIVDTIVFFGSARLVSKKDALANLRHVKKLFKIKKATKQKLVHAEKLLEMSNYYEDAVELSRRLTEWSMNLPTEKKRFIICSGGGPGIMEAANKGAFLAKGDSIGLNISIPYEQFVNPYVKPQLAFEFHYFFMRKFWFVYLAKALIVFPGGFGTLDEFMEVLTLVQTKKIKKEMKVIVYDEKYWREIINFDALVKHGTISKKDLRLFDFCNSVDEAFEKITTHFKKYYLN
ncbi:LOG family protein [Melioribacteraceae bacterium 4301-Me]|uniref:LOG family protein n=1 Tax=Pyranulibacter aquaticus TaxID=3163344 RepID=UPI00359858A1